MKQDSGNMAQEVKTLAKFKELTWMSDVQHGGQEKRQFQEEQSPNMSCRREEEQISTFQNLTDTWGRLDNILPKIW